MAVYAAVLPGSLIAPAVLVAIGPRGSMFVGALPYLVFGLANVAMEQEDGGVLGLAWFVLAGSGVGCGCGILWGAQGVYITEQSAEYDRRRRLAAAAASRPAPDGSLGLFTGVGGASTTAGGVFVGAGSSVLLGFEIISRRQFYILLAMLLLAGNLCFLFLPQRPAAAAAARKQTAESPCEAVAAIPALLRKSQRMRLLMVCFVGGGYANAFMSGSFTAQVVGVELGVEWIGAVMAFRNCFGIGSGACAQLTQ